MRASILILILLCISSWSFGQTETQTCYATVTSIFSYSISNPVANLNLSTISEVKNGKISANFSTISVKSNKNWQMSVRAQSPTFSLLSLLGLGGQPLPSTALKIKPSNGGGWKDLTTSDVVLKSGNKGDATKPGNTFDVDVKFQPGLTSKGGIYTLGLIYTLTQP